MNKESGIEGARHYRGINNCANPPCYTIFVHDGYAPFLCYSIGIPSVRSIGEFDGIVRRFNIVDWDNVFTPELIANAIQEIYTRNVV